MNPNRNSIYAEKTMNALLLMSLRGLGQKECISILDRAGFGPTEIAAILDTTPKNVGVRLAEMRRKSRTKSRASKPEDSV